MSGMLIRRIIQVPIIIGVIYTITFLLAWQLPGNPLEQPEGRRPTQEVMDAMKEQYNQHSSSAFYFSYI
jgi:ABC-type dipeptide/oligopeptide/nickel transport system permease component